MDSVGAWKHKGPTTALANEMAKRLVALLREDLSPDEVLWSFEDAGSDMHGNIYMARASDNRYFALELWWSED
jgi:hypothetical protein